MWRKMWLFLNVLDAIYNYITAATKYHYQYSAAQFSIKSYIKFVIFEPKLGQCAIQYQIWHDSQSKTWIYLLLQQ